MNMTKWKQFLEKFLEEEYFIKTTVHNATMLHTTRQYTRCNNLRATMFHTNVE